MWRARRSRKRGRRRRPCTSGRSSARSARPRPAIGVSERALAVLDALLSFHPETALSGEGLIVFPSNQQLALRAHGMPPATLRRHLAALVDCGLIIRRDSPNGKRFARKGQGGAIEMAFGFDLSPLGGARRANSRPGRRRFGPRSAR